MAATATVLELLDSGDHIISMDDLYGGTYRLFENVRKRSSNLDFSFVDLSNIENLKENLKPNTKMIWVESPSNPLLKVVDLKRVVRSKRTICCVSATILLLTLCSGPWILVSTLSLSNQVPQRSL